MTEAEWNACNNPAMMLEFLRGQASERKLRLFAVACCRHIWHLLKPEVVRVAVETADGFADKRVSKTKMTDARKLARAAVGPTRHRETTTAAADAAIEAANRDAATAAWRAAENSAVAASEVFFTPSDFTPHRGNELRRQQAHRAVLLRCIFANRFHPVAIEPLWRTSTVVSLAQAIYEKRDFDQLPILADALEDAGCDQADLLAHCRGPGPHVRGCFAVDLVLGKE